MTLNSALSQNCAVCTMRTPRNQVARTLRAQCPGRGRCCAHSRPVARMSHAQLAQVAHVAPRSWAQVATSLPYPTPGQVATSIPGRDLLEANPCRDIKLVSRHRSGHSRSRPLHMVTTPFLLPSPQARSRLHFSRSRPPEASPMLRHRFHVATSFLPIVGLPGHDTEIHVATSHTAAHVATSNPCRDVVSAQPKQTRSRRHFLVATSRQTKLIPT